MKNGKKNEISNKVWIIIISICLVLIIFVAIGFAVFSNREDKVIERVENGGNIVLNYANNLSGLKLIDTAPTTDAIGMTDLTPGEYFDFSIDVNLDNATSVEYEISIVKDSKNSTIDDDDIRIYLEKENSGTFSSVFSPSSFVAITSSSELGSPKGSMILYHETKKKSTAENYRLRVWLSDSSVLTSGNYSVEVLVNGVAK